MRRPSRSTYNSADASATPRGGGEIADATASASVKVINLAPIEVTRDRVRRGDVEIQYFNTSYEDVDIEMIRVEWDDPDVFLEFASHQDGVPLEIGFGFDDGCYNGTTTPPVVGCLLQADIDPPTTIEARTKDWLKLSFVDADGKAAGMPAGLTVTIVLDEDGGTFTWMP